MANPKKPRTACLQCRKETARARYTYCSNTCQFMYQHTAYIKRWKEGKESGLRVSGIVNNPIKRYLRDKFGNKCYLCGWAEVNPKTLKEPLVADHIDGDWRNNSENNLRLICPNCDSLSPTYAALNKGKGRAHRAISKRTQDARRAR